MFGFHIILLVNVMIHQTKLISYCFTIIWKKFRWKKVFKFIYIEDTLEEKTYEQPMNQVILTVTLIFLGYLK